MRKFEREREESSAETKARSERAERIGERGEGEKRSEPGGTNAPARQAGDPSTAERRTRPVGPRARVWLPATGPLNLRLLARRLRVAY